MSLDFLNGFIHTSQQEAVEGVQKLIEEKKIKEKMLTEAQNYAQAAANHITDESYEAPPVFQGIPAFDESEDTTNYLEYQLVLEYLESIGLKFAPTVFRYESQNPNVMSDRQNLSNELRLRSYDKTPLLVQMVEELRKSQA